MIKNQSMGLNSARISFSIATTAIHVFQIATIILTRVQSSQKVVDLVALSMCRFLLTYLDLAVNHNGRQSYRSLHNGRQSYRSLQRQLSKLRNNVI